MKLYQLDNDILKNMIALWLLVISSTVCFAQEITTYTNAEGEYVRLDTENKRLSFNLLDPSGLGTFKYRGEGGYKRLGKIYKVTCKYPEMNKITNHRRMDSLRPDWSQDSLYVGIKVADNSANPIQDVPVVLLLRNSKISGGVTDSKGYFLARISKEHKGKRIEIIVDIMGYKPKHLYFEADSQLEIDVHLKEGLVNFCYPNEKAKIHIKKHKNSVVVKFNDEATILEKLP